MQLIADQLTFQHTTDCYVACLDTATNTTMAPDRNILGRIDTALKQAIHMHLAGYLGITFEVIALSDDGYCRPT
jgi:hypothetical protein